MVKFILSFIDYNYIVEFAHKIIIYFLLVILIVLRTLYLNKCNKIKVLFDFILQYAKVSSYYIYLYHLKIYDIRMHLIVSTFYIYQIYSCTDNY